MVQSPPGADFFPAHSRPSATTSSFTAPFPQHPLSRPGQRARRAGMRAATASSPASAISAAARCQPRDGQHRRPRPRLDSARRWHPDGIDLDRLSTRPPRAQRVLFRPLGSHTLVAGPWTGSTECFFRRPYARSRRSAVVGRRSSWDTGSSRLGRPRRATTSFVREVDDSNAAEGLGKIEKQLRAARREGLTSQETPNCDPRAPGLKGTTDYGDPRRLRHGASMRSPDLQRNVLMWTEAVTVVTRVPFAYDTSICRRATSGVHRRPEPLPRLTSSARAGINSSMSFRAITTPTRRSRPGRGVRDLADTRHRRATRPAFNRQPAADPVPSSTASRPRGGHRSIPRSRGDNAGAGPLWARSRSPLIGLDVMGSAVRPRCSRFREKRFAEPPPLRKLLSCGLASGARPAVLLRLLRDQPDPPRRRCERSRGSGRSRLAVGPTPPLQCPLAGQLPVRERVGGCLDTLVRRGALLSTGRRKGPCRRRRASTDRALSASGRWSVMANGPTVKAGSWCPDVMNIIRLPSGRSAAPNPMI